MSAHRQFQSNPGTPVSSSGSTSSTPPRSSLSEIKAAARKAKRSSPRKSAPVLILDPFTASMESKNKIRGKTGFVFDEKMAEHFNPWDSEHIECPQRILRAKERCDELGLTKKCQMIDTRNATKDEMLLCHSEEYLDQIKKMADMEPDQRKEECLTKFHSVYMNEKSYECAELAAGSAIELTKAILDGEIQNGLALLRPPGHHALNSVGNGFCLLNNVAIAAKWAKKEGKAQKILIVDLDVHHGQSTQYNFYDDPNVLYFSIHRYEHGLFFPHLRESNFDYIGGSEDQPSCGKNFNIPLNKFGLGDEDYLSIFHQILMPVTHEFRPDLILVSAGYDSAIGCPEGRMKVTPAAYGHLIHTLMSFAEGRVGVFLEGGYFVESLAEGVAMSLRALLGEPCLSLDALPCPDDSTVETNLNVISMQRSVWQSLAVQDDFNILKYDIMKETDCHVPALVYKGQTLKDAGEFGEDYEINDNDTIDAATKQMEILKSKYEISLKRFAIAKNTCALAYDEAMMGHACMEDGVHPEQPLRIKEIYEKHKEFGLLDRVKHVESRKATDEELTMVHESVHVQAMKLLEDMKQDEREKLADTLDSIYLNDLSYNSALLATGNVLSVIDEVCTEEAQCGVAIVRPPGHHAEADEACGFCLFNNVAVGAKYALEMQSMKRILILDWDVHHGNGIQHMFYDDPRVLYISIHRFDEGTFFPGKHDADHPFVGNGAGKGFNINIPWNGSGMGDPEYSLAFFSIILPVAYQFNPDLVLVSSGFDAARGDPLGRCKISPEFYGFMTHHLRALANGKVVVALEGGYNLNSISLSMTMVTKALLGDPMPHLAPYTKPLPSAIETVRDTIRSISPYWSCLKYGVKLPHDMTDLKKQMAMKFVDFIKKSTIDYIPGQFAAFTTTFGINTLSDIKTVNTKIQLKMVEAVTAKKDTAETVEILNNAMKNIRIDSSNDSEVKEDEMSTESAVAATAASEGMKNNPNVYIPNQFQGYHGQSAGVNTVSQSATTMKSTTNTSETKKKKPQEDQIPTVV